MPSGALGSSLYRLLLPPLPASPMCPRKPHGRRGTRCLEPAQPCRGRDTGFDGSPAACELSGLPLSWDTWPIAAPASRGHVAVVSRSVSEAVRHLVRHLALSLLSAGGFTARQRPVREEAGKALALRLRFPPCPGPHAQCRPGCQRPPAGTLDPTFPTDSPQHLFHMTAHLQEDELRCQQTQAGLRGGNHRDVYLV